MPFRKRRLLVWIPLGLVAFLALLYAFLNPIVAWTTQRGLDRLKGVEGSFHNVRVTLIKPGYNVYGLKIVEKPVKRHKEPLFYAERVEMRWSWRELIRGHLVRRMKLWQPRATIPMRPGENGRPAQPPLEIARTLESVPSAGLERLSIVDGQVTFVDLHHEGQRLWLHKIEATLENVASRRKLMRGMPVLLTLRGKLQSSGDLTLFLTADPFDKGLTFAGSAELRHMALADLYQFTTIEGLKLPDGQLDLFASVTCKRGQITGGIKPILKNVKVEAAGEGLGNKIKAALADAAVNLLSDRVPGRNAVAAIIPIHGDLKNPDVQVVPAVLAVLRNAFVEGLSASLSNVPPPVAGKPQGFFRQARQALSKKSQKPIQAQPQEQEKK
jgi:Domain of Unknown Function (DUF748)